VERFRLEWRPGTHSVGPDGPTSATRST
jgi:hypothetical protein